MEAAVESSLALLQAVIAQDYDTMFRLVGGRELAIKQLLCRWIMLPNNAPDKLIIFGQLQQVQQLTDVIIAAMTQVKSEVASQLISLKQQQKAARAYQTGAQYGQNTHF